MGSESIKVKLFGKDVSLGPVLQKANASLGVLKVGLRGVGVGLKVAAVGGTALTAAVAGLTVSGIKLDAAMQNLQALTGATDQQIKTLRETIRGMAQDRSADQVAAGVLQIGSEMPSLLEDFTKLGIVSKNAYQSAMGNAVDFTTVAQTGALIMNAWKLEAEDSERVYNELGNSIRNGSAFFMQLSEALKVVAPIASQMKIKTSELLAVLQKLALNGKKGSEAGTGLASVMLSLATNFRTNVQPQTVGLVKALQELEASGMDNTEMMKVFGKEGIGYALLLGKVADASETLSKKIEEEAALKSMLQAQSESLIFKTQEFTTAISDLGVEIGDLVIPALKDLVTTSTHLVQTITRVIGKLKEYPALMGILAASFKYAELKVKYFDDALLHLFGIQDKTQNALADTGEAAGSVADDVEGLTQAIKALTLEQKFLKKRAEEANSFENLANRALSLSRSVETATERFTRLRKEMAAAAKVMPETLNPEVLERLKKQQKEDYARMLIDQDEFLSNMNGAFVSASTDFADAVEGGFFDLLTGEAQDFEKEFEALVKRLTARLAAAGFMKLLETIFGGTQFGSWLSSGFTGQAVNIKTPSVNTSLVPNTKTGTRGKAGQVMIPQIPSSSSVSISAPLYVTVQGNAGPDLEQSLAAAGARWQQQVLTVINQRFGRR